MIDAFCSQPQFVDHLAPIWQALPDEVRGTFQATGTAGHRATQLGIRLGMLRRDRDAEAPLTMTASYLDEQHVRPRATVLVEHGAGQDYAGGAPSDFAATHPSYPGGTGRESVCLFIAPAQRVADRWTAMYPDTPVAVVGCPRLDPWHVAGGRYSRGGPLPLVVFTAHWDCGVVPECGSAFTYYMAEWTRLAKMSDEGRGWRMGGHAHPRAHEVMAFWRRPSFNVQILRHFDEVLDQGDLLVVDNSSVGFEFASTDRPVVWLNQPSYRRDVEHGLRFWSHVGVGTQCDEPVGLVRAIDIALSEHPSQVFQRQELIRGVYAYTDGHASERAAAAIVAEHDAGYWRGWRERRSAHDPFSAVGVSTLDGMRAEVVRRLRAAHRPLDETLAAHLATADADEMGAVLDMLG